MLWYAHSQTSTQAAGSWHSVRARQDGSCWPRACACARWYPHSCPPDWAAETMTCCVCRWQHDQSAQSLWNLTWSWGPRLARENVQFTDQVPTAAAAMSLITPVWARMGAHLSLALTSLIHPPPLIPRTRTLLNLVQRHPTFRKPWLHSQAAVTALGQVHIAQHHAMCVVLARSVHCCTRTRIPLRFAEDKQCERHPSVSVTAMRLWRTLHMGMPTRLARIPQGSSTRTPGVNKSAQRMKHATSQLPLELEGKARLPWTVAQVKVGSALACWRFPGARRTLVPALPCTLAVGY